MRLLLLLLVLFCSKVQGQKDYPFGHITLKEKELKVYKEDPEAHAVVLYEKGENYFEIINNRIWLVKEFHNKTKILDNQGFDKGTIEIHLYHNDTASERVEKIEAITQNENKTTNVLPSQIFTLDINEKWKKTTFTFPAVQVGSILEYRYRLISTFHFNFNGWHFQSDIPKLYSEFNAKIPGNYVYNRDLAGYLNLDVNEASLNRYCFHVPGIAKSADCEVLKYAMKDIPAFEDSENYMLASKNYISHLTFELAEYHRFNGDTEKYTKTWESVDKEFRNDRNIGAQLTKKNFFEKNVPPELLIQGDDLERAKRIYQFVQQHYTWNKKYGIYDNVRVKQAFREKIGNVGEINITLINLFNAANIPSNLMLLSTRDHGLPKTNRPVMTDFNYVIAKTEINGKTYLLDATDKFIPFGMLPFRCLNHYGRVMDFKKDSYWLDIAPELKNRAQIQGNMEFDLVSGSLKARLREINQGYNATKKNRILSDFSTEAYLDEMENSANYGDLYIDSYELKEQRQGNKTTIEEYELTINNMGNDVVYVNPFLFKFFTKNPFLKDTRNFPVDFGYPLHYKYSATIKVPEDYVVKSLPETKAMKLSENGGSLNFQCGFINETNTIQISFVFSLDKIHFNPESYQALKDFFGNAVTAQQNSLISLTRKQ